LSYGGSLEFTLTVIILYTMKANVREEGMPQSDFEHAFASAGPDSSINAALGVDSGLSKEVLISLLISCRLVNFTQRTTHSDLPKP
jgi:hypothetical protein